MCFSNYFVLQYIGRMLTIRTSVVRSVLLCLHKQVRTSHIKNYHYYGIEGCSWTYCRRISLAKFYQKPFAKVKRCQSTLSAAMSPGIIQSPLADVAIPENAALAQHIMSEFLKHGSKIAFVSRDFFFLLFIMQIYISANTYSFTCYNA